uniref:DUF4371 domain-containing protein n=1 Tax=Trichuris muris TaxID=70415 RepID=A0A5S6QLU3_TRIMR
MKPSRLQEHLKRVHADKSRKDMAYFKSLWDKFRKKPTLRSMLSSASQEEIDGLLASYNISLLIAKSGKPHSIGEELLLPVISEVLRTLLHISPTKIIRKIPLSNSTVQRRIDEMSNDIEETLCGFLRTRSFALQLDESTLPGNEALLLAYVRFIKDERLAQELLFAKELVTDTKGESIFRAIEEFFKEKNIPLTNIMTVATDGAPSTVGSHRGFIAHLKKVVPSVLTVHCVIHRQHLVAKRLSDRLSCSLQFVIAAVNKIKSKSLNERLFGQLCETNDEDFNRLLLHTEVRWLSKGTCLSRFYSLFDTVLEFLGDENAALRDNLKKFKSDIAYLTELYFKFNEMNLQLQGDDLNLIKTKAIISAFVSKLVIFKRNLGRGEFCQFPLLAALKENTEVVDDDILVYCNHLEMLHADFMKRFIDILSMKIPDWVVDPFCNVEEAETELQEELVELQHNEEIKPKFRSGYHQFWLQRQVAQLYPRLWAIVEKLLIAFPSSYLAERGFSAVTDLLSKKRNRLQIVKRGDLRIMLTNINPDVKKLASLHQAHPSH